MATKRISTLELFKQKVMFHLTTYAKKMKLFIAEEGLAGSNAAEIRKMRKDPDSSWSKEREALNKDIKREVAGIVNKIHTNATQGELK